MLAVEQNMPLNSSLLEQEPLFGFDFDSLSTPDSNGTSNDITKQENRTVAPEESRRLRRMKSNRESARRSRMRKRIHTEELQNQFDQLQAQNHDLRTRLRSVLNRTTYVWQENRRIHIEAAMFKRRLDEARTLLLVIRQLPLVNVPQNFHAFGQRRQASVLASLIA